ncbi:MAG: hypothetical protein C7B45_13250 [Sulfobacillus acidophilus]|uniref:Isochorismatase-like domain-containing protein n=1 Tax=Sulfobacillus acidophilus TaxID=53633 RepID=A0A2T2WF52_9FIRM|nr:MAG: hypothetical protein C7B45_13250 [Sulfobacillus acidophilus]
MKTAWMGGESHKDYGLVGRRLLSSLDLVRVQTNAAFSRERTQIVRGGIGQHLAHAEHAAWFRLQAPHPGLHPVFVPRPNRIHVVKHFPHAFLDTNRYDRLQRLNGREIARLGMMTPMCSDAIWRAAFDSNHQEALLHDATGPSDRSFANGVTSIQTEFSRPFTSLSKCRASPNRAANVDRLARSHNGPLVLS